MLKLERKTKVSILSRIKKYMEPKTLMRRAVILLFLSLTMLSLAIAICGIVYLGTILVISLFVGRIITTGEGLILAGLIVIVAIVAAHLFADLGVKV